MEPTYMFTNQITIMKEIRGSIDHVIKRKDFILGEDVVRFECEVAEYLGVKHAIGLNSGSDAFRLALATIGIKKGDEVILPTLCFASDVEAVVLEGGTSVFVDIEPTTSNIDISLIQEKITDKTKAIIAVHMYGVPIDMDHLMEIAKVNGILMRMHVSGL